MIHENQQTPHTFLPYYGNQELLCARSKGSSELTNFLLKMDLLMTRLSQFTDRPAVYSVCKSSFFSINRDLQVSLFEEFDLLVKWFGPESGHYALSFRASNANCLIRGLQCLWQRLDECYGSPVVIEADLKTNCNCSLGYQIGTVLNCTS